MIEISKNGITAFVSQLIYTDDKKVIAVSICGREMLVKGIIAQMIIDHRISLKNPHTDRWESLDLTVDNTFRSYRLNDYYQTVLWNKTQRNMVVGSEDLAKFINARTTVPFHPAWEKMIWDELEGNYKLKKLQTYGIDKELYLANFNDEVLQETLQSKMPELKAILSQN